jgi:hypothetical protein
MDGAREPVARELASAAGAVAGVALLGAGGAVALEGLRPYSRIRRPCSCDARKCALKS